MHTSSVHPPTHAHAHASFLMTDPVFREVFKADYCITEVGGPTLIDRYGRPTKTYVQVYIHVYVRRCCLASPCVCAVVHDETKVEAM